MMKRFEIIAQVHRASAICSLWKIYECLFNIQIGFLAKCFRVVEKVCARNYWTLYKLVWPKYQETKQKYAKKRNFLALKDIFLTFLVAA